jgi:TetR/AcrR family fatty acid metabolism transcriptional regulator
MAVQQARARDRQQRILEAAADVFAQRGYGDAAVEEIATSAGTSKGGLYFHFPGKEALLMALLDHTGSLLMGRVQAAMEEQEAPVDKAAAALLTLLRTLGKHRSLARIFAMEALGAGPKLNRRIMELHQSFETVIEEQLDDAIAAGAIEPLDTRVTAQAWVGILNAVLTRWLLDPQAGPLDALFPTLRRLLLQSIGLSVHKSSEMAGPAS